MCFGHSGTDQGLGQLTTESLARKGFLAFAGCLTDQGVASWREKGLKNVRPFKLDVTSMRDIEGCADMLARESPAGLL